MRYRVPSLSPSTLSRFRKCVSIQELNQGADFTSSRQVATSRAGM